MGLNTSLKMCVQIQNLDYQKKIVTYKIIDGENRLMCLYRRFGILSWTCDILHPETPEKVSILMSKLLNKGI